MTLFTCPCCHEGGLSLEDLANPEDHRPERFTKLPAGACVNCADNLDECAFCDGIIPPEDHTTTEEGEPIHGDCVIPRIHDQADAAWYRRSAGTF